MIVDRLIQLDGVETDAGRRHVQVRDVTSEQSGQSWTLYELYVVRGNGDWDYVTTTDVPEAMRWLCGLD